MLDNHDLDAPNGGKALLLRMSKNDREMLDQICARTGLNASDALRATIAFAHGGLFKALRPEEMNLGRVAEGAYTVENGVVTLTDRDGNPATDERGKEYKQKLRDGENPKVIAGRLTREFRSALRGNAPVQQCFDGPIHYAKTGWR